VDELVVFLEVENSTAMDWCVVEGNEEALMGILLVRVKGGISDHLHESTVSMNMESSCL
jgi:hypothetical protein